MKRTISLMLVLAFALVLISGCGGSPEKKLEKAQAAVEKGDFDKAIDICTKLLEDKDLSDDLKAKITKLSADAGVKKAAEEAKKDIGG